MSKWTKEEVEVLEAHLKANGGGFNSSRPPYIRGRSLNAMQKQASILRHGGGVAVPLPPSHEVTDQEIRIDWDDAEEPTDPGLSPTEVFDAALPLEPLDEHRLKSQVRELRAAKDHLLAELQDREEQIHILKELRAQQPVGPIEAPKRVGAKQRYGTPVMLCSDWHVEEGVDPKTVNGLNEYNLDIADRCIDELADAFEWLGRDSRYDCREAVIWLGGDLFSGYIHEELMEANFLSPVEAVVWLQSRIERMLRKVLATTQYERILVPTSDGNHGRLTHKMRVATRTSNSLEWLLYSTLAAKFVDEPRIQFQINDGEYNYVDILGQHFCFFHGDSVRYMGGVGGLLIPMKRALNEMRKYRPIDVTCFGHFHQRIDLPDMVGNGSLIGINPYSMRIHCAPEPRQQSWFLVDSARGKCISTPVWLAR